jgi:hypothetical protein
VTERPSRISTLLIFLHGSGYPSYVSSPPHHHCIRAYDSGLFLFTKPFPWSLGTGIIFCQLTFLLHLIYRGHVLHWPKKILIIKKFIDMHLKRFGRRNEMMQVSRLRRQLLFC